MVFTSVLLVCAMPLLAGAPELVMADFGAEALPDGITLSRATMERVPHENGFARLVRFEQSNYFPSIVFKAPDVAWDWSAYSDINVSLYNPTDKSVRVFLRVDNDGGNGTTNCNNAFGGAPPRSHFLLTMRIKTTEQEPLWGMRGVPMRGPVGSGPPLDKSKITAFHIFLNRPQEANDLIFERVWLSGPGEDAAKTMAMPFIDPFGQYKHADWPGKVTSEEELKTRLNAEAAQIGGAPELPNRDAYGGWGNGPKRTATGWFRTEHLMGKWWLITPDGHLFLSIGMNGLDTYEQTWTEGRGDWFEWLPDPYTSAFESFFTFETPQRRANEPFSEKGLTFSFYKANLLRKYGQDWQARWIGNSFARLKSWGFNTLGINTSVAIQMQSRIPFTASFSITDVPMIAASQGYWGKMMDVYDPSFREKTENSVAVGVAPYAANPLCIGYFVDNELPWEGVVLGTLRSPVEQPARKSLIALLKTRYPTVEDINKAWGVKCDSWDTLDVAEPLNNAARVDIEDFLYLFADRYFTTVRDALNRFAPNQLYLGCRFTEPPEPVLQACAESADVISGNFYYERIPIDRWNGEDKLIKPFLVGEFHFGALDHGMFHAGLMAVTSQQERADKYVEYWKSVADHPGFIGAHWFQYLDQPVTGRTFDGENYNSGFVDVTDTPYPEMVEAAKKINADIFRLRFGPNVSWKPVRIGQ